MLGAVHIDPPHFRPMRRAKFVTARQIENGMHAVAGGGQARRVQQITGNNLHLGPKQPASFLGITAQQPQTGAGLELGAHTVPANKTGRARDKCEFRVRVASIRHGDFFTNLIPPSIVRKTTDAWHPGALA